MIKLQSISPSLSSTFLLIGLAAMLCAGCATDGVRQRAAYDRKIQRTERLLIAAGDADSLAAAALLSIGPGVDPVRRLTLIARAVSEAPDRPDLVWLNVRICTQVDGCNPEALEAQLRALDSDNGAAWFDSIGPAAGRNDEAAVRKSLAAIETSTRFDTYWNTTIVHVTDAMLRTKTIDLRTAFTAAIGVAAATVIPPYQAILNACKGESLKDHEFVATCRQVASVMRRGDTYMTELVGLAIAKRTWPEGSAEFVGAVSARRVIHYRIHIDGQISLDRVWSSRYAAKRLHLMTKYRTEQEVVSTEILNAKMDPNPPSDWAD
jgi:hypothetical protein